VAAAPQGLATDHTDSTDGPSRERATWRWGGRAEATSWRTPTPPHL